MIGYNVNNSISHPPHPRRAVPANLPPGAFFIRLGYCPRLFIFFIGLLNSYLLLGADQSSLTLSEKISNLRLKSNAHGKHIAEILAKPVDFDFIGNNSGSSILEKDGTDDPLSINASASPPNQDSTSANVIRESPPLPVEQANTETTTVSRQYDGKSEPVANKSGEQTNEKLTYDALYSSKVPQKRIGYYFGPFLSAVFPDDSTIRGSNQTSYDSKGGVASGLRIGNDFGHIRIEGEYSYLTYKISDFLGVSGRNSVHNLQSRVIVEKSLGDRADLRAGIGLGLAFVNKELNGETIDGVGFSYDFLLGFSFRVMDNWSLGLDYKHYLTSAHQNYDRLQGHAIELSAGFDL